jgi:outer membrane immunogenic protein
LTIAKLQQSPRYLHGTLRQQNFPLFRRIWGSTMKKLALVAVATTMTFSGAASAADMAVKALPPAPIAVIFSWTGFYIGGSLGGHWGSDRITTTTDTAGGFGVAGAAAIDAASPTTLRPQGFIGGGQIGYNWQASNFVFGLEADASWLDGSASRVLTGIPVIAAGDFMTNSARAEFLATFRGRAGVAFDRALFYLTGGLAVGTVKTSGTFGHFGGTVVTSTFDSTSRAGWTVGAGLEYAFTNNWSAKVEYLYVDLGSFNTNIPSSAGGAPDSQTVHHKYTDNIARVGLNYRWGGPVVAKY